MRVALLSDIHDHTTHLLLALQAAHEQRRTHLLFMGDMAASSTFSMLHEEWPHSIDLVFGNNECETNVFTRKAEQWPRVTLHGAHADIMLDSRRVFFCHLPWQATKAAASGKYDAVFYGHTHTPEILYAGSTLLVNPGEICGRQNAPTIGVYDTTTNQARIICI